MQILARNLNGSTVTLNMAATSTVASTKAAFEAKVGVPAQEQRMVFAGRMMADDSTLAECGVTAESCVRVSVPLVGGGKKRKKKAFSTPKHKPRVRKAVKMAVLRYFSVDADGNVKRTREVCPKCSAGVYLAEHKDRRTCGRCGYSVAK